MAATTRLVRAPARWPGHGALLLLALVPAAFAAGLIVGAAAPLSIAVPGANAARAPGFVDPSAPSSDSPSPGASVSGRLVEAPETVAPDTTPPSLPEQRVTSSGARIDEVLASFAAAGLDPVLVGAGDIADCITGADKATARLIDAIPGVVFTAGDEAYPAGSAEDFSDCYDPSWGRFRDRTLPAIGNHEWGTPNAAGFFGYFGSERPGQAWYSLDVGAWHVIVLDSDCDIVGCGLGSAQLTWLTADLAAHPTRCTLAIWHHPRFSSGGHGNDTAVAPFWRALMRAGADLIVNGHDHDYERFARQRPSGRRDPRHGIREIVAGTGGAHLRYFHAIKPNSRVRLRSYGVLRLTLHPASYSWRFIRTDGSIADAGASACH